MVASNKKGGLRTGGLTIDEKLQIDTMIDSGYTDKEISDVVHRSTDCVMRYRAKKPVAELVQIFTDEIDKLHNSHLWNAIKLQLFPDEIAYFEQSWAKMMEQFADQGISYSDELMVRDYILFDIEINRISRQCKAIESDIKENNKALKKENEKPIGERDTQLVQVLSQLRNTGLITITGMKKQSAEIQKHKEEAQRQLKMDRANRFKSAQESRVNFLEKVKILSEKPNRRKEGRLNVLAQIAGEIERLRLSQPVDYGDDTGGLDIPFLCPPLKNDK